MGFDRAMCRYEIEFRMVPVDILSTYDRGTLVSATVNFERRKLYVSAKLRDVHLCPSSTLGNFQYHSASMLLILYVNLQISIRLKLT